MLSCVFSPFKIQWNLNFHMKTGHKHDKEFLDKEIKLSDLKYSCEACDQKFVSENILKKHRDNHLQQFKKKIPHMNTHTYGDKTSS